MAAFPGTSGRIYDMSICVSGLVGSLIKKMCKAGLCESSPVGPTPCDLFQLIGDMVTTCLGYKLDDIVVKGTFRGKSPVKVVLGQLTVLTGLAVGGCESLTIRPRKACCHFREAGYFYGTNEWTQEIDCPVGKSSWECCQDSRRGYIWDYHTEILDARIGYCY